jgi:hypothetical protein
MAITHQHHIANTFSANRATYQRLAIQALQFAGLVELDVSDGHADEVDKSYTQQSVSNSLEMSRFDVPPAVIKVTSQVKTSDEEPETCKKERNGKHMTTQKHQIGTPLDVQCVRNFGARPSRARP